MKYLYIKQKVFSFIDRYKVYDEGQKLQYEAKGKFFTLNSQKDLYRVGDQNKLFTIKQKILTFVPTYYLFDADDKEVAKLAQQLFVFFGTKYQLVVNNKRFSIEGDLFSHQYDIKDEDGVIVSIRKKWISWGDTYEVSILDTFDEGLAISIVLMIDDALKDRTSSVGSESR
jgi:uncharacterized protein YxjI